MPNTKSAKKRLRQNVVRRARNRAVKRTIRTRCRRVLDALRAGNVEEAETLFPLAVKQIDKAAAKRVIHRNKAARLKSRLSAKIRQAKQPARVSAES